MGRIGEAATFLPCAVFRATTRRSIIRGRAPNKPKRRSGRNQDERACTHSGPAVRFSALAQRAPIRFAVDGDGFISSRRRVPAVM